MITSSPDTLVCDTIRLAKWQSNPAYDYNRELVTPDINLYEWLMRKFRELLMDIFGSKFAQEYSGVFALCIVVVILIFLVWFIYWKRPELFMRSRKKKMEYTVEEDTIYGIDFDIRISEALARNDYKEAVRLLYLQSLKQLSDGGRIDWQLYKTPTQYIGEVRLPAFRQLTNNFLRVRYGNFDANLPLFEEMRMLQQEIWKGGDA